MNFIKLVYSTYVHTVQQTAYFHVFSRRIRYIYADVVISARITVEMLLERIQPSCLHWEHIYYRETSIINLAKQT